MKKLHALMDRMTHKPLGRFLVRFITAGIIATLLFFLLECFSQGSLGPAIRKSLEHFGFSVINILIIMALLSFFWVLTNHLGAASIVMSVLILALGVATFLKKIVLAVPLLFSDIVNTSPTTLRFITNTNLPIGRLFRFKSVVPFLFLLIIMIVLAFIFRKHFRFQSIRSRLWMLIPSVFTCLLIVIIPIDLSVSYNPKISYRQYGFICGLIANAKETYDVTKLAKFDVGEVESQLAKYPADAIPTSLPVKNVIVVMSEAFFDLTTLPNVTYSEDPIPNLHALQKTATHGTMISPTYGGTTSNPEFEFLTGFSTKFFPFCTNVYTNYLKMELPSMATYFHELGFATAGIHTNDRNFFNRARIYPLLGFDKFIGAQDMQDTHIKGKHISDDDLTQQIIKQRESTQGPLFTFAISMQNHYPYDTENYYNSYDLSVQSDKLNENELMRLRNYAQGVHDADKALKDLVDYFDQRNEPTAILFFGDHLPALDPNLNIYKKLGFVTDTDFTDASLNQNLRGSTETITAKLNDYNSSKQTFMIPFVMWNNIGLQTETVTAIGSNHLGPYLLNRLGLPKSTFQKFLLDIAQEVPASTQYLTMDKDGNASKNIQDSYAATEDLYKLIQKETMFGKNQLNAIYTP